MSDLHLDEAALRKVIEKRAGAASKALADRLAKAARERRITVGDEDGGKSEYPLPVRTFSADDGPEASVVLAHPAGKAVEQKHRLLRQVAAGNGLEIQ